MFQPASAELGNADWEHFIMIEHMPSCTTVPMQGKIGGRTEWERGFL